LEEKGVRVDSANLCRDELETKMKSLARYGGITDGNKVESLIQRAWNLENETDLHGFVF
jgi:aconitate decarboxylase